jgi:hypothetical protein
MQGEKCVLTYTYLLRYISYNILLWIYASPHLVALHCASLPRHSRSFHAILRDSAHLLAIC